VGVFMKQKEAELKIAEAFQQDVGYGRARIDNQTRLTLDLSIGDVIEIEGLKKTAAVVWRAHPSDEGKGILRIDNLTRKNSGGGLGDRVKIRKAEVKEAKDVSLAPLISKGQQIQFGEGIDILIKKGLLKRPLTKGDSVIIPGIALFGSSLPFIIINTNPGGIVSISEETFIKVKEEAAREAEIEGPRVSYEDIGGLHDEILKVREMIELPLKHPELFDRLGIDPPKGVLLHGPPGTGKTLIAKAVANESNANFYTINGPEIMCVDGETEIFTNPKGHIKAKEIFTKPGKKYDEGVNTTIELAEPIKTYSFKENKLVKGKITHVTKLKAPTYKLAIGDGFEIKASNNQPFLINENGKLIWKRVSELKEGVSVARINIVKKGESYDITKNIIWEKIKNKLYIGEQELYDFTVDKDSFVGGPYFLLHNSKFYGQSEENLRKIFEEAEKNAPSIVFIDEIDAIAPKRSEVHGEVERRVVSQLLTLMDGLKGRGKLIVIGATNIPDSIDPALRRPGRFDREIIVGAPDRNGRKEILQIHTRGMPMDKDVNLEDLADITYGYVGADLAALARESAMSALRRYLPDIDLEKPIPIEILEKMEVTMDDFKNAHRGIEPSAMREFLIEIPKISWEDIGGLEEAKQQLQEAVEWPLTRPEVFKRMGINPPRGILLYGPPGTGKTLLAKAVAGESNANFISIKGPEVMSKWVGESEKAVRELFKKARQVAPSIVFLDEIDSIAPPRGSDVGSHVTDSVVNQLLTSIDGLESMEGVVVIGATNRPDIIDPGLLRPGRFDRLVLIRSPDKKARLEIFKIHTKSMPIDKDVNLEELSEICENYSGADIEALCREAAMLAIRENAEAKKVKRAHFEKAMETVRASITPNMMKFYEKVSETLGSGIAKKDKSEKDIQYL